MMEIYHEILDRLSKGPVYLKNDYEQVAIKYTITSPLVEVKDKTGDTWKSERSSRIATDTLLGCDEITEQEFNDYDKPPAREG